MFTGSLVALITPFDEQGAVDIAALRKHVRFQIDKGTHGLVAAGTTGEAPTLHEREWVEVVSAVVDEADGQLPVIAGCGANDTRHAVQLHKQATELGANAALHVTGYYNRPDQRGILEHYHQLSQSSELPVLIYHIPHRTGVVIELDTMLELAQLPGVIGVKDSSQDLKRPVLESLGVTQPFACLTGEDATAVAYNAAGGVGCISVTANVAPDLCSEMQQYCLDGDFVRARAIQAQLMPLHQALFREPSPAGVKYAAAKLGLCLNSVRSPLLSVTAQTASHIDAALASTGLQTQVASVG
ncbi:MAG: 4-hydroxy-tetrahydrodipicolinate synthase [Gammaproteobacteria bacterium]|nr:4-hydroxy-tetrahydrodipicolinate synthase [Gammaproteobacteria bacterium]